MRYLISLVAALWFCAANANELVISDEPDSKLGYVLNNFFVLFEKNNPDEFPAIVRLVSLPDQADDCSWVTGLEGKVSGSVEDQCPQRKLYLTLSSWDIAPDQHTYLIGSAVSWMFEGVIVNRRESQSDWQASIKLQVIRIIGKRQVRESVSLSITNKYDVYSVELLSEK